MDYNMAISHCAIWSLAIGVGPLARNGFRSRQDNLGLGWKAHNINVFV